VNRFLLWIARGFGIGRIPVAPGTFGSVAGLCWVGLLLWFKNPAIFVAGMCGGLALSVWACGNAEATLGSKDPPSVVLDEIAALPVCFLSWLGIVLWNSGTLPGPRYFITGRNWIFALAVFAAFRFFDILKPWPVRQSQSLPGGWGITVDDVLAAVYVNLVVGLPYGLFFSGGQ
jgi:phosphatidylglycerophosphatase A